MPTIASTISNLIYAINSCQKMGNGKWEIIHTENLSKILDTIPHGSGLDISEFSIGDSTPDKLVFIVEYHHMDENGCYDGWTKHKITARPSFLLGVDLTITGRNRNGIKDYIGDMFYDWLTIKWDGNSNGQ